ncbi:serine acetyltransferase [Aeribacillus pallidus]|nr:serine acetyltransferase [Aeribacillus pallidus]
MRNLVQDFKVNNSVITKMTLATYRYGNFVFYKIKIPVVRHILLLVYKIFDFIFNQVINGSEIPAQCKIGKGLSLPHGAKGIVIHKDAVLGDNVTLLHQVTIGSRKDSPPPRIGNNVSVGAGAKIIGDITVGDFSKIGANAVVISDVPPNSTAVGIPAKIKVKSVVIEQIK